VTKLSLTKIYSEGRLTRAREVVDTICRGVVKFHDVNDRLEPFMVRALGLLKHFVLSSNKLANDVWLDTLAYFRIRLECADTATIAHWMYPSLYNLTNATGEVPLPLQLKTGNVDIEGIYALSTGLEVFVWIVSYYIGDVKFGLVSLRAYSVSRSLDGCAKLVSLHSRTVRWRRSFCR
jgi:hypothetical protein